MSSSGGSSISTNSNSSASAYEIAERVVGHVIDRILKVHLHDNAFFLEHGPNNIFLASSIVFILGSDILAEKLLKEQVRPLQTGLSHWPKKYKSHASIMVSLALRALGQKSDQVLEDYIESDLNEYTDLQNELKNTENLFETENCYWQLLNATVNLHFSTMVSQPSDVDIYKITLDITYANWTAFDEPLRFDGRRLVHEDNRNRLYFFTHVVYIMNHYGMRRIGQKMDKAEYLDFYNVLLQWAIQFVHHRAVDENVEEFSEVMYALLFLSNSTECVLPAVPARLMSAARHLIQKADSMDFQKWRHGWYPNNGKNMTSKYTSVHSMIVVATLMVELVRYDTYMRAETDEEGNSSFKELERLGYLYVRANGVDWLNSDVRANLLKKQSFLGLDILLRTPPAPEQVDVFLPIHPTTKQKSSVQDLRLPCGFWGVVRNRISLSLGLPVDRIMVITDETYVRLKEGAAQTPVHADFFYFVRSSNVFQLINNTQSTICGMCTICRVRRQNAAYPFCSKCLSGYIPVFTAWISLGNYSSDQYSLLEVLKNSHMMDGFEDALSGTSEVPSTEIEESGWTFPSENILMYDMVLFNCKTLHRARAPKNTCMSLLSRTSIDVRFLIVPP